MTTALQRAQRAVRNRKKAETKLNAMVLDAAVSETTFEYQQNYLEKAIEIENDATWAADYDSKEGRLYRKQKG